MTDRPDDLTPVVLALIEQNLKLRSQLEHNEQFLRSALSEIAEGSRLTDVLEQHPVRATMEATDHAVTGLFEARHKVRNAVIRIALSEGMSVEDIANVFGASPDRVRSAALDQFPTG